MTMKKIVDLWYCKARKSLGDPIMVRTWDNGKPNVTTTDYWEMIAYDENQNKIKIRVRFNNTTGQAKSSGATSMLEILSC